MNESRFGNWEIIGSADDWGDDRGPDPVSEFGDFARHVAGYVTRNLSKEGGMSNSQIWVGVQKI